MYINTTTSFTPYLFHQSGTFTTNNFNVTFYNYYAQTTSSKTLNLGSSNFVALGGTFRTGSDDNITVNAGTSTIILDQPYSANRTFIGGGRDFYNVVLSGVSPTSSISAGSGTRLGIPNRFNRLSSTINFAHTIIFAVGHNFIFKNFDVSGTAGNLVTIRTNFQSQQAFLSKPGSWYVGANSVDSGNNAGLIFTSGGGIDYLDFIDINATSTAELAKSNMFMLF